METTKTLPTKKLKQAKNIQPLVAGQNRLDIANHRKASNAIKSLFGDALAKIEAETKEVIAKEKAKANETEQLAAKTMLEAEKVVAKIKAEAREKKENYEAAIARLKANFKEKQTDYAQQIAQAKAQGQEAIAKIKIEHKEQINKLKAEAQEEQKTYEEQIAEVKAKSEEVIAEIKAEHEDQIAKNSTEAQEAIANLKTEGDEQIDKLKVEAQDRERAYDQQTAKAKTESQEAIAKIKAEHEQQVAKLKTEAQEKQKAYEEQIAEVKAKSEEVIAEIKAEHEEHIKKLKAGTQEAMAQIRGEVEETVARQEARVIKAEKLIAEANTRCQESVAEIKGEAFQKEQAYDQQIAKAKIEHEEAMAQIKSEHEQQVAKLRSEVELASGAVSEAIRKMVDSPAVLPGQQSLTALDLCAEDIMQKDIAWAGPDDTIQQTLAEMQRHSTDYVMVGNGSILAGMVSRPDLNGALSPYLRPAFAKWRRPLDDATLHIKLKWVMIRPVHIISPKMPLAAVIKNMCRCHVRCLPVVDQNNKVLGLVAEVNIFKTLLKVNSAKSTCDSDQTLLETAKTSAPSSPNQTPSHEGNENLAPAIS